MSRNLLPFDFRSLKGFGLSIMTLKLAILRQAQKWSFRNADGLIFLTKYAKDVVLKSIGDVRARVEVIPHGVSPRFIASPRSHCPETFRVVYISRIEPYKHHTEVIEAATQLRQEGFNIELLLYGQARERQAKWINSLVDERNGEKPFIFFNRDACNQAIPRILAESDIGLFASSCENMPNTLLEYMASGLPIACSACGPMPEVLGNGGIFFDPRSPLAIKESIKALLTNRDLRTRVSEIAQSRAAELTWEKCAEQTWNFLRTFA
jgi:glycosyltransferase involved in cell wall biosynthesis